MLGNVVGGAAVSPHPNSAEDNTAWIYRIVGVPRPASSSSTMKVTTWSWRSRCQRKCTECGNQFLRQPSTLGTSEREYHLPCLRS